MSFWSTSDGAKATGEVQENNGFDPLPLAYYTVISEETKVNDYQGKKSIAFKLRVVSDKFNNRIVFPNLKTWDPDPKKRDRAIQLLVKLYNVLGVPLPNGEPDDMTLSRLSDKPFQVKLDVYDFVGENGKQITGNFIVNFEAKSYQVTDKDIPQSKKVLHTAASPLSGDPDDGIPF